MTKKFIEIPQRIRCPHCGYPMKILEIKNKIYQCYCADCKTDRFMKEVKND